MKGFHIFSQQQTECALSSRGLCRTVRGAKPGGAVEMGPGKISDEGFERVQKSFNESFSGEGIKAPKAKKAA